MRKIRERLKITDTQRLSNDSFFKVQNDQQSQKLGNQKRTFVPLRIHKPLPVLNLIESSSAQKLYICNDLIEHPEMESKKPLDPLPKLIPKKKLPVIHPQANSRSIGKLSIPVKLYNDLTTETISDKEVGFPQRNMRLRRPLKNVTSDETCSQNINHILLNLCFLPSSIYCHQVSDSHISLESKKMQALHHPHVPSKVELECIKCERFLTDQMKDRVQIIHQESTLRPGSVKHHTSDQRNAMRLSSDQKALKPRTNQIQFFYTP